MFEVSIVIHILLLDDMFTAQCFNL